LDNSTKMAIAKGLFVCHTSPMARYVPIIIGILGGVILTVLIIEGYHGSAAPGVCISCHSMAGDGAAWQMSNHKQFACVDCHMPDAGIVQRFSYKARAGLHDLWHETLRDYPASLTISQEGKGIAEGNCVRCHQSTVEKIKAFSGQQPSCTQCHRQIVHRARKEIEE
jgi:cytochrome c nitrite reductase small subunit